MFSLTTLERLGLVCLHFHSWTKIRCWTGRIKGYSMKPLACVSNAEGLVSYLFRGDTLQTLAGVRRQCVRHSRTHRTHPPWVSFATLYLKLLFSRLMQCIRPRSFIRSFFTELHHGIIRNTVNNPGSRRCRRLRISILYQVRLD